MLCTTYRLKVLKKLLHITKIGIYITLLLSSLGFMGFLGAYLYAWPQLPDVETLKDIKLQTPMRIYTREGLLINEFGEKHRIPIAIDDVPEILNKALIATEDQRFYQHGGVDFLGMIRVAFKLISSGRIQGGGSTITMQVARNFFLTFDQTLRRKLKEIYLSWKIEGALDKRHILELYWNKINFGQRAYGIGAAAQVYYGSTVDKLTLPQLAILAGIPKGPSTHNPISNPEKALNRRNHVLWRTLKEGFISEADYQQAIAAPLTAKLHGAKVQVFAPYLAEMVRRKVIAMYGESKAYNDGLKIYTTLQGDDQLIARKALRLSLIDYDKRHGYRGPEQQLTPEQMMNQEAIINVLKDVPEFGKLYPAIVTEVNDNQATVIIKDKDENGHWYYFNSIIQFSDMKWAKQFSYEDRWTPPPKKPQDVLAVGDQIRMYQDRYKKWHWSQLPEANAAFVALDAKDGAIRALEGGFDFDLSKFNRVTQARRQPGSNIKPFIYSAALEKGFTAASIINDSPRTVVDSTGENIWRPKNDLKFRGPTRLRFALAHSINLVSVRLLEAIGIRYGINYITRFGLPRKYLPPVPSLALGTAHVTPLELVTGYAAFANGGFKIEPYYIDHIEDNENHYIFQTKPLVACPECEKMIESEEAKLSSFDELDKNIAPDSIGAMLYQCMVFPVPEAQRAKRIIDKRNLYIMRSIMHDVITRGTATRLLTQNRSPLLKRSDIGGKTGTTNDAKDTWFSGFANSVVATAWVGFDAPDRNLGFNEYGGKAALPIWEMYMEKVLKKLPQTPMAQPEGIVSARIDPKTGKLAPPHQKNAIFEIFRKENVPTEFEVPGKKDLNPFDLDGKKLLDKANQTKKKPEKDDEDIF